MKLSTRSRYGVRLMFELALEYGNDYTLLRDVAERQGISEKYLSKLVIPLKAAKFLNSARGFHGGYSLARDPASVNLLELVETLEGDLSPVDCTKKDELCGRMRYCPTQEVWRSLAEAIRNSLKAVTLGDLVTRFYEQNRERELDYCI